MEGNTKRRAEGTNESGTDPRIEKKQRTSTGATPTATTRTRRTTERCSTMDDEPKKSPCDTRKMFDDLKHHFDMTSSRTSDHFERLIGQVDRRVTRNSEAIIEIKDTIKRLEGEGRAPRSPTLEEMDKNNPLYQRERYEAARKMLRMWPVNGKTEDELRNEALRFISDKLRVPRDVCTDQQIVKVRRTKQPRVSTVNHEALVIFTDKFTRDAVVSHAKNLSQYRHPDGKPSAGLRMNYPDHLTADFRILDWYGKQMFNKHGAGTKRNIKFDDDIEGLRIDVKIPEREEWFRVYPAMARDLKIKTSNEEARRTKTVLEISRPKGPPLTGGNAVLRAPVLSTPAQNHTPSTSAVQPIIVHDPDEVIYITPSKRSS